MGLVLWVMLAYLATAQAVLGSTDPQDAAILHSLMDEWQNTPPSWGKTDDPCGQPWEGVECSDSQVTALQLSTMDIEGTLGGDIGQLRELKLLDLSYNKRLGGPLTPQVGNLKKLAILILAGCSFIGNIPDELGSLGNLSNLALNSNQFTGKIPPSLGKLLNLYWLDLGDNQLTGPLPISTQREPGLDQLVNTKHFHFNKNQLSGSIAEELFSSNMTLIHVLFDGNQFTGHIPYSIGLVQTLEVIRLDRNNLDGRVPSNINNLTNIIALNLANNQLTGPIPNLTGMINLNYVDLSNNTFDPSESPAWFTELQSLTTLVIESGGLFGNIPQTLFSIPQLQQVILDNNAFDGTLDMGEAISKQLQIVNLMNNALISVKVTSDYNNTLILVGNPVCNQLRDTNYCTLQQKPQIPYSTSLANCIQNICSPDQSVNPQSCSCAYPYEGEMVFRAPFFRDVTNNSLFQSLEMSLWTKLGLTPGSVIIKNLTVDADSYLRVQVKLFPSSGEYFNRSEILRIGFDFSNQTYKPPRMFGPYYFIASPYLFPGTKRDSSLNTSLISGIAVGCVILVIGIVVLAIYALRQRKQAERAIELGNPFASWSRSSNVSGDAPQLKGARWFSYDELKKSTNNFSEANEIGSGGYGKVYKGLLPGGQVVAIKRAQEGSVQGGLEFKTEIELLSRVHHVNLVGLVGFCFEQGEQMLVYEFIPNGTLRESLSGKSPIQLDWKRRLLVALSSAKGLGYLHELADPPIIHRDVKSSNILLDDKLNAKVADFGLSKLVLDNDKGHVSTQVKGTMGYLDPEYYMTQQLTGKSDVYSFGVLMLELITGKQPIEKGKYIVCEVKMVIDPNDEEFYGLRELIDPAIRTTTHLIGFRMFAQLALRCVEELASDRPTMNEVVKEIEMILQNGLSTNSISESSSATDFGSAKGIPRHPYIDSFSKKDISSDAFEYSGGYSFSGKLEPK